MAERQPPDDLERALGDLRAQLAYPPTPDLAARVQARVEDEVVRRPSAWHWLALQGARPAFAALVLLVIVVVGTIVAMPEARTAVADRLGLRGVPIQQVPFLPAPGTAQLPSPAASPGAGLDLGDPVTLERARTELPILLPTIEHLGTPDGVYLAPSPAGGRVSLVYAVRPGLPPARETGVALLLLESRLPVGGFEPAILGKGVGPSTRLEAVTVNGGRGVWVEGAPHALFLPDASGQLREDRVRLAGNVLLWEQAGLLLRLEGALSRDEALHIAGSVR